MSEADSNDELTLLLASDQDFKLFQRLKLKPSHLVKMTGDGIVIFDSANVWRRTLADIASFGVVGATLIYIASVYQNFK